MNRSLGHHDGNNDRLGRMLRSLVHLQHWTELLLRVCGVLSQLLSGVPSRVPKWKKEKESPVPGRDPLGSL